MFGRPLAGTRRRGKTPQEDQALERELLADEKECSEHVMLVDLGRNDVGKVAQMGSVDVQTFMQVERYSHVMHISSTVKGKLLPQLNAWDVMRAALPAGTVSGAPKVSSATPHLSPHVYPNCTPCAPQLYPSCIQSVLSLYPISSPRCTASVSCLYPFSDLLHGGGGMHLHVPLPVPQLHPLYTPSAPPPAPLMAPQL